jgi:30S ribosomal protein S31
MGKGDIKSRKGKLANGSFGRTRLRNETRPKSAPIAAAAEPAAKAKTKKAAK